MLKLARLLTANPAHDQRKPLPGALEPIPARPALRRLIRLESKIRCTSISRRVGQQDFISRRVKFTVTGAEVGDHEGHLQVVDVGIRNAGLRHPSSLLLRLSPPARSKARDHRRRDSLPRADRQQIRGLNVPLREPHPNQTIRARSVGKGWRARLCVSAAWVEPPTTTRSKKRLSR